MATTLFTTYKAPVNSFPAGQRDLGIHKSGRYSGFDLMQSGGALNLIINHSGKVDKTSITNSITPAFGAILFKTGIVAHIEDPINVVIETNSGNPMVRRDLIIAENIYQEVTGGTPVTFSIIKGPNNSTALPNIPNPATQEIVGILSISANGYQYSDITYEAMLPALPGDLTYEVLASIINTTVQVPPATTSIEGKTRYATNAEAKAKVIGNASLTPANLNDYQATTTFLGLVKRATAINITGSELDRSNPELYITPELLKLFEVRLINLTQDIINNSLPGQATTTVPGILRITTPQELAARQSKEVALTPGHLPSINATNTVPGLMLSATNTLSAVDNVPSVSPENGALTLQNLRHLGLGTFKVIEGTVMTTNAAAGKSANDWNYNNFRVNLPWGYGIEDLVMFNAMLYSHWLSTGASSNDIFINWRRVGTGTSGYIGGVAGTTSTSSYSTQYVRYTAIFIKKQ